MENVYPLYNPLGKIILDIEGKLATIKQANIPPRISTKTTAIFLQISTVLDQMNKAIALGNQGGANG